MSTWPAAEETAGPARRPVQISGESTTRREDSGKSYSSPRVCSKRYPTIWRQYCVWQPAMGCGDLTTSVFPVIEEIHPETVVSLRHPEFIVQVFQSAGILELQKTTVVIAEDLKSVGGEALALMDEHWSPLTRWLEREVVDRKRRR